MLAVAFPRCTATDKRCRRYSVDFGSPDSSDMRRPSSLNYLSKLSILYNQTNFTSLYTVVVCKLDFRLYKSVCKFSRPSQQAVSKLSILSILYNQTYFTSIYTVVICKFDIIQLCKLGLDLWTVQIQGIGSCQGLLGLCRLQVPQLWKVCVVLPGGMGGQPTHLENNPSVTTNPGCWDQVL